MSFMDNLKRSLGYEETETNKSDNKESALDNLSAMINLLSAKSPTIKRGK